MRASEKILLQRDGYSAYSPTAGGRSDGTPSECVVTANVTDMGAEEQALIYGKQMTRAIVARVNHGPEFEATTIIFAGEKFTVTRRKAHGLKTIYWAYRD